MLFNIIILLIQVVFVYSSEYDSQQSNNTAVSSSNKLGGYKSRYGLNNGIISSLANKNSIDQSFKASSDDSFAGSRSSYETSSKDIKYKKIFLLLNDIITVFFAATESELSDDQSLDKFVQDQVDRYIAAKYTKIEVFSSDEFRKKHPEKFYIQSQQNSAFFPEAVNDQFAQNKPAKNQIEEYHKQVLLAEKELLAAQAAEHNKKEEERRIRYEKALSKKITREQEERDKQAQQDQAEIDSKREKEERNAVLSQIGSGLHQQKMKILDDFYHLSRELADIREMINEGYSFELRSELSQLKIEIANEQDLLNKCKKDALKKQLVNFENSFKKLKSRIDAIGKDLDSYKKIKEAESVQENVEKLTPSISPQKKNVSFKPIVQSIDDPKEAIEEQFLYRIVYCSCLNNNASVLGAPEECIFCKNESNPKSQRQKASSPMLDPKAASFYPGKRRCTNYNAFLRDYCQ